MKESNIKTFETNPHGNDKTFIKSNCLSVIIRNKKNLLKKVVPITHTGENAFSVATIWGLWIVSFQTEQKNLSYALVGMNHFCISIEEKTTWILLKRGKFVFLFMDISFDVQKLYIYYE